MSTLVLLRIIGQTFGVSSPPHLAWLVAGYSLTVGTFIMLSGRLGDVFGHKRMLTIGFAWFSLWSLVAGLSVYSGFTLAVLARVLQGIGPAICLPNALAILGTAYPPGHRKAMVFAFFGAVAPIGGVSGGLFASLLTLTWWPWALWAMALWLAMLAVAAHLAVPKLPRKPVHVTGWRPWLRVLDLPGAAVGVSALILFIFAWTQAPIDGWATPTVLVPLILGLVLFAAFIMVESRLSAVPLLPFDAINAEVAFVLAAVMCGWATFGVWTLYLVQVLQDIRQLSPLLTTAWFSPITISGARCRRDGQSARLPGREARRRHDACPRRLHRGGHPDGVGADGPNVLGTDFRLDVRHSHRNGHELPRGHSDPVQRRGPRSTRASAPAWSTPSSTTASPSASDSPPPSKSTSRAAG